MFEDEIKKIERKIDRIEYQQDLIVFYGSSSIRLWVTIEKDLTPLNVINLGFGGSSFEWMSYYFHRVFRNLRPAQVVIYGGDNDLSLGLSAMQISHAFQKLREQITGRLPEVQLHGMTIKPSPARLNVLDKIKETNHLLKKAATSGDRSHQINIFQAMLSQEGLPNSELFMADDLHMNRKGYDIWTKEVRKYFDI